MAANQFLAPTIPFSPPITTATRKTCVAAQSTLTWNTFKKLVIRASIEDDIHKGDNKNTVDQDISQTLGLHNSKGLSAVDCASRDSKSHRRPLSAIDLSNSARDGSRIRGVSGEYSESAAEKAYPGCEVVPCEQFDIAFQAVENWLVDRAVLPIENSLGGSIHRNYDLLLRHWLHIIGEVQLVVRHCLLANHGVGVEDLKRVLSHPQALAQCENTLTKLGVIREAVNNTAGAAQFVALHQLKDTGAVASLGAASIYDLNVLAQDIQDDSDNITRFLMLAREPIIPGTDRPFKTSIVFSLEEGPGVLFKALAVFAMRNINLTKIESRPQRRQPLRQPVETTNGSLKYPYARNPSRTWISLRSPSSTSTSSPLCSSTAIDGLIIPSLHACVLNESTGSHRQTFSSLAAGPALPETSSYNPISTQTGTVLKGVLRRHPICHIGIQVSSQQWTTEFPHALPFRYFDYLFYVDFEASMANPNSQNALRHLKEFATFLRVLGSYPMDISLA
ncbi:hypothetical protein RJ639_019809 [Escallonia herrerae]|uniref:arogenate dehydratase n=1 Tax=Escallonia herrerae TaxID=1293975 RepID=A0AA89AKF2_9ASTE|nr:hypothetical protein RJ639_019809 [Escallonia herrerae]